MYFRICRELGYPHPDIWLRELTGRQVAEWEAYYLQEPFGEYMDFWQTGLICSMIANIMRKKGSRVSKPEDFIPDVYKSTKKQTKSDIKMLMETHFDKRWRKKDYLKARRKSKNKK